jgi:medium-chain acyl-[acyl-carrier-protein] hydrolase
LTAIEPVIQAAVGALSFDKPFVFFGHSMGALLAFEVTRCLRREGLPGPLRLYISGARAPKLWEERETLSELSDDELRGTLREMEGIPEQVLENEELMQLLLPILRADFSICDRYSYVPGPPLSCPILALGGDTDTRATRTALLAWNEETTSHFRLHMFAGGHFFLHSEEPEVLRLLNAELWHLSGSTALPLGVGAAQA